jgi:hypothetical protein
MKKIVGVALAVLLLAPTMATARGGGHGGGYGGGGHSGGYGGRWHGRWYGGGHYTLGPYYGLGLGLYGPWSYPYYYSPYGSQYYYPDYAPPIASYPAPAPQIQRQVCYATGCYFLQGDGYSVPYQWVWVPNQVPTGSPPPLTSPPPTQ